MDRAGFIDGLGRGSGNLNPRNERTLGFLRCQQGGRILVLQSLRAGRDQYHRECSSAPTDFEIKHTSNYKELMCRLNGNLLTRCAAGLADKPEPYEPERTRHSSVVKICGRLYVPRSWHPRATEHPPNPYFAARPM